MEEAERLADRVAVFADGRVIALDTPAGIVSMVDPEQRLRFRPSTPVEDRLLTDLPEVRSVQRTGQTIVVSGTGNLIGAVTAVLARAARSSPTTCGSSRRASTTPTSPSPEAGRTRARTGAVMNELRALIATEAKLVFREPDHLARGDRPADGHPADLRLDLRAERAGSRARRPALHRRVRAVAASSSPSGRWASRRCPIRLATYREKGVLRRLSTTPAHPVRLLAAQLVASTWSISVVALVLLVVVANVAFGVPLPGQPLGYVVAFLLGMTVAVRDRPAGRGGRPVDHGPPRRSPSRCSSP